MLWTIFVVLLILWLLGFSLHVGGSLIHLLLVVGLVDSSQLESNALLWIGMLSVWPSMRRSYGVWLSEAAIWLSVSSVWDFGVAEPESKKPASRKLMTRPSRPILMETVWVATWLDRVC